MFSGSKKQVEQLPPLHRHLALERNLGYAQPPEAWEALLASIAGHDQVTGGSRKYALPGPFLTAGVPLLRVILADARANEPVALLVDDRLDMFYGPSMPLPDQGHRFGRAVSWAVQVPIQAEARLRDGSRLRVRIVRRTRRVAWRQRGSYSRKVKFKSRRKEFFVYQVRLRLPRGVAPVPPAHPAPGWLRAQVIPGERSQIKADIRTAGHPMDVTTLLHAMTEAFRWSPKARASEVPR